MTAASDRFAWKYAPVVPVRCGGLHLPLSEIPSRFPTSLVRFSSLDLYWKLHQDLPLLQGDFHAAASVPLLRLRISGSDLFSGSDRLRSQHIRWLTEGVQLSGTAHVLTELDLYVQSIRDEGAKAVADLLPLCTQLRVRQLCNCGIGNDGVVQLASAIAAHPSIREVALRGNHTGTAGLHALLPVIYTNSKRLI
jgi:hypothetical protein